jgi:phosphoglucomutase
MDTDPDGLTDAFYRDLEFGTGGLRGIMGVGTNRMNKVTVGMATQGLANYIRNVFPAEKNLKVAIAFDSRNNSAFFARIAAEVLSANGIKVFLGSELRPTPWLSFAVRELQCHSGIVITASHNPKEYNGYKVYWNDGGQLVSPHDTNVITEVQKIKGFEEVRFDKRPELIELIGSHMDTVYLSKVTGLSHHPEIIKKQHDLKIVYTPLHGTGITLIPKRCNHTGLIIS